MKRPVRRETQLALTSQIFCADVLCTQKEMYIFCTHVFCRGHKECYMHQHSAAIHMQQNILEFLIHSAVMYVVAVNGFLRLNT
jgi:hypothetical protein